MKKFFALLNSQVFIESLDLSFNELLNESFAQFALKFLDKYELSKNPRF